MPLSNNPLTTIASIKRENQVSLTHLHRVLKNLPRNGLIIDLSMTKQIEIHTIKRVAPLVIGRERQGDKLYYISAQPSIYVLWSVAISSSRSSFFTGGGGGELCLNHFISLIQDCSLAEISREPVPRSCLR